MTLYCRKGAGDPTSPRVALDECRTDPHSYMAATHIRACDFTFDQMMDDHMFKFVYMALDDHQATSDEDAAMADAVWKHVYRHWNGNGDDLSDPSPEVLRLAEAIGVAAREKVERIPTRLESDDLWKTIALADFPRNTGHVMPSYSPGKSSENNAIVIKYNQVAGKSL